MIADLHFHSKFSDGTLWPAEMVEQAAEKGLEMIALTDHDTFEGVPDFLQAARQHGIIGIPAIEIDFIDDLYGFKSELLGYFPKGHFKNTAAYLARFSALRRKLAERSLELAGLLYDRHDLSFGELLETKLEGVFPRQLKNRISLTKPDIFNYFELKSVPHGYPEYQLFKKGFFNHEMMAELNGKPVFSKCLECIRKDGGYPVLAHPAYQFEKKVDRILDRLPDYIAQLKSARDAGLWGIELHAYENNTEASMLNCVFSEIAALGLLHVTYGSDSHGPYHAKKKREIGCIANNFSGFTDLLPGAGVLQ